MTRYATAAEVIPRPETMPGSAAKVCPLCGLRYDGIAAFCQKDGARLTSEGGPDRFVGKILLGQFRIEEAIGAGGMGTVYRAHQTTLNRNVAVKILHPELTKNDDAVRRFHREAKVATSLEHPNLVRVFLFGELPEEQALYLVMEYLDGTSVADLMRKEGALPVPRALHLVTQICAAIGAAHDKGIVHRDVKPDNLIVLNKHGDPDFVKVLDFGIARLLWDDQSALTQSGVIFGTARYISPEGASGEPTDARSDVYSIGVLLYQLLTGVTPFEANAPVAMLMKHIHERPPDLRSTGVGDRVPRPISDVVMRALAKNPDARLDTATELGVALANAAADAGITPSLPANTSIGGVSHGALGVYRGPTPQVATEDPIDVPGLSSAPRGLTLALAFLVGAALVVLGVLGVQKWLAEPEDPMAERIELARQALEAERYDTPPQTNVAELTASILGEVPEHPGALEVRAEAASRLRTRAISARAAEDDERAQALFSRVLVFAPGDPVATTALAELEEEARQEREQEDEVGLSLAPPSPAPIGSRVRFLAVVHDEHDEAEDDDHHLRGEFVILRGRRTLRRIDAVEVSAGHFVGDYAFRTRGTYTVVFELEGTRFEAPMVIERRSRPNTNRPTMTTRTPDPVDLPPPSMGDGQPTMTPTMMAPPPDDGIDWTVPPAGMTGAPPPWTG